jgi:outer membrane protein W
MKTKFLCFAIATILSGSAMAQNFKPVKVGLGMGYARPGGEGSKAGVLVYFEPAYRVNDKIAVGLRMEAALMARVATVANSSGAEAEAKVSANGSYTLNGQYYFLDGGFRPFAGLGFGIYSLASATVTGNSSGTTTSSEEVSGGTEFGFYPRVGFDAGHFSFNLEYNIIPTTEAVVLVTSGNGTTTSELSKTKNSYIGFKMGFFFGGGRK